MAQRVLLAEKDDTIRGVAETVLRQNGFEVIAVNSSDKASEILEFSVPDLLLVDASLMSNDGRPCFQSFKETPRSSSVPMLLLADAYDESFGMPAEAVIIRPFDPADLVRRAKAVLTTPSQSSSSDPLAEASLDDNFLDAALGLDDIEVTDSEDMNKTGLTRIQKGSGSDNTKIMGVGNFSKEKKPIDNTESSRVESLMISDENSDINVQPSAAKPPKPSPGDTAGLQIMSDQYGLNDPETFADRPESDNHDYDWFVKSVRSDHEEGAQPPTANQSPNESAGLTFSDPAKTVDPITPGPPPSAQPQAAQPQGTAPSSSSANEGGMDKFIDEFRQEVERLGDNMPESVAIPDEMSLDEASGLQPEQETVAVEEVAFEEDSVDWEDKIEKITPEHMRLFTRDVAAQLADKIAAMILAKIDHEKLLRLIKDEIVVQAKENSRNHQRE